MTSIESHAIRHQRLHPQVVAVMRRWFPSFDLGLVRVIILRKDHPAFGLSGRQSGETPAFVLFRRIFFEAGVLNAIGYYRGNTFDLATPEGFAGLAHEVFHVFDYFRDGAYSTVTETIKTMLMSWQRARILWDHKLSANEQQASELEAHVRSYYDSHPLDLKVFGDIR